MAPASAGAHGPVEISADPVVNFRLGDERTRFGRLEFVGGLRLSAETEGFGGFSGLRLFGEGLLAMVSDNCLFLTATLLRNEAGAPRAVAQARLQTLPRDGGGRRLSRLGHKDCEALEIADGQAYIAFETSGAVGAFTMSADGDLTDFRLDGPQAERTAYDSNRGIEAMARFPDESSRSGQFVAIAEETLDERGDHIAYFGNQTGRSRFSIARSGGYAVTDADFLPDGDLVILERRFALTVPPSFRIRRLAAADIASGARVDGEVLIEAGLESRIDNMEGIDAWRDGEGRTRLTLVSDDNFNFFQSTLLLEFVLAD